MPKTNNNNKVGRYTREKIEDWITPEKLILLTGWCMDGYTEEEIAKKMGISKTLLYNWKNKNVDIMNALKKEKKYAIMK
jgi:hypothetical protein